MIRADFHVHTDLSSDGKASMEEMIEQAIRLGLTCVCFTEHMDYDFPETEHLSFVFDPDRYQQRISACQEIYGNQIQILRGVELGIQDGMEEKGRTLLSSYPFDFVIASTHLVDGMDPYYPEFWEGRSHEDAIHRSFCAIAENIVRFPDFDSLGHLDYIMRYCPGGLAGYVFDRFERDIETILEELIRLDKCLEVNTNAYRYGFQSPHPIPEVLSLYKSLGGKKITVGSDAHEPSHLAQNFDRTQTLLLSLGFSETYWFSNRIGSPVSLLD